MTRQDIDRRGLVLLGCGKMGSAMLSGWLDSGLSASSVTILDPFPSEWLRSTGVHINTDLPDSPAIVIVAVKPQMMAQALPQLKRLGNADTLFVSVAAGTPISAFEEMLGAITPVVRAMPNTPAAVGKGITALIGNDHATETHVNLAEGLLQAVGATVRLQDEGQMDAVTGVSGSGPAYVFHLIETLAEAGVEQGLDPDLAMSLAKATVAGAGVLAEASDDTPEQLRINVTSPNGTTQAALEVLMDRETGLPPLMVRAVAAATDRSKELSNG
ncbi:MAG: pyrroline-5-carboxylate reductase [Pseudomonadota bacterium]